MPCRNFWGPNSKQANSKKDIFEKIGGLYRD